MDKYLKEEWNKVYKTRKEKVGKKKARISANARVKSLIAKDFIIEKAGDKELDLKLKKDYKRYLKGKYEVILTTDKKVLKDYKNESIKGQIKDLNKDKYIDVINDVVDEYDLRINQYMYYVIFGDEK